MADIELTVAAPGADNAARQMDNLGKSVGGVGNTWDLVKRKVGSGEVLRNAAASAALLASGSGNATQKVAALGGALSSIPGPVGMIAAGVAVAATVLDVFSKSAEEARKQSEELAAALDGLGKQRQAVQSQIAGQVTEAALKVGADLRAFRSVGGSEAQLSQLQGLSPGDPNTALRRGRMLAESGLSEGEQSNALRTAEDVRRVGDLTDEMFRNIISTIKENSANLAPIGEGEQFALATARAGASLRGGGAFVGGYLTPTASGDTTRSRIGDFADVIGGDRDTAVGRFNRAYSAGGSHNASVMQAAEAPAVAQAEASVRSAGMGGIQGEALRVATEQNRDASLELTRALRDLTDKIKTTTANAAAAGVKLPDSDWVEGVFSYGRNN